MLVSLYGALEDVYELLLSVGEDVPNLCVSWVCLKLDFCQLYLFGASSDASSLGALFLFREACIALHHFVDGCLQPGRPIESL
jgi:hypothetical protein